ncbi:hypothetical protein ACFV5G_19715 [Streptomyces sp. NPDC059766]|uniref:hypothetical protein n=1 Tax=Streptomyces sp. NPDC059766 TaxID=3346940 RepID=UPI00366590CD
MTEQPQVAEPTPTEEPQRDEPVTVNEPTTAEAGTAEAGTAPAEPTAVDNTPAAPESESEPAPEVKPEPAPEVKPEPAPEPGPAVMAAPVAAEAGAVAGPEPVGAGVRPPKDRRILRAVLRWTAAVGVFAAVASASAYGITGMERTDVPGLGTQSDGRWDYPALVRPPLPSGSPAPFAEANTANAHYADLRALVLPAPKGATPDKALLGTDGWLPAKDYLAEFAIKEERQQIQQKLVDYGLRHIAARGWTTPDGTRTRIYLLQFGTAAVADKIYASEAVPFANPAHQVRGAETSTYDEAFPEQVSVSGIEHSVYFEEKPYGAEQVREACVSAGDVFALIVQSRKGGAAAVPFQQTVALQDELLG